MIDTALQAYIWITAVAALYCMTDIRPRRRFLGYCIGLAGQPAWLIALWPWPQQWGLFGVCLVYTGLYAHGVWVHRGP